MEDDGDVSGPEGMEGYSLPIVGEEDEDQASVDGGKAKEQVEKKNSNREAKEEKQESEFAKEFWEKRGERNRAAKRRVREAKKEQRRADNKKRPRRD